MILLIDWGNSLLKYVELAELSMECLDSAPLCSVRDLCELNGILNAPYECILVSSVRNESDHNQLSSLLAGLSNQVVFANTESLANGISCAYKKPAELGVDRWLGIAASQSFNKRAIISIGSAITLDFVVHQQHLGGQIIPGYRLLFNSLLATARVRPDPCNEFEASFALGDSTTTGVQQGINTLIQSYLEKAVNEAIARYDIHQFIFTGGGGKFWSKAMTSSKGHFYYEEKLVFKGLLSFYDTVLIR